MQSIWHLLTKWREFVAGRAYPQPPEYAGDDVVFGRFIEDSRIVQPNDCFVARVRPYSNGHRFIAQAIAKGATLIIAQAGETIPDLPDNSPPIWIVPDTAIVLTWLAAAWHDFPAQQLTTIGVTGTDGKTSIANILYEMLVAAQLKTGMISTIKAVIGNEEMPTGLHVTTPQAPQIQALLRRMVDDGCTHCVLEVTSMGLAEHRADTAFFDVAVMSNVKHEHLDYHGSWEAYLAAKMRLFELAPMGIVNMDDVSAETIQALPQKQLISYGIDNGALLMAESIEFSAEATRFALTIGAPLFHEPASTLLSIRRLVLPIDTALVGRFNIENILAAAGVLMALGLHQQFVQQGIAALEVISGRMERISAGQSFLTIVDFAHTPNALLRAIEASRGMTNGRIISVFGSAGRRDVEKRRMMAEVSAQHADLTILTAEDPRQEPLADILQMMADGCIKYGGVENKTFWRIPDRGRAIYHALSLAQADDLVLICGKGHEQSMCFGVIEYPWDDRDATRAVIGAFLAGETTPDLGLPTFEGSQA
ncbi:MAG: UDP-N-acetylmuramoyl-L-alanyl-D-glutamate--2,6-diaminopimelate ligase [Candidatus Promineifilaceae bacterium]